MSQLSLWTPTAPTVPAAAGGEVRLTPGNRALYANDASIYRQPPLDVVTPRDEDDVLAALEVCRRHEARYRPAAVGRAWRVRA